MLGRMSRLKDCYAAHQEKRRDEVEGARLSTQYTNRRADNAFAQVEKAEARAAKAEALADNSAARAEATALAVQVQQQKVKLEKANKGRQTLKGRLRQIASRMTPVMVKNFIDKKLRPGKAVWSFEVMSESARMRNHGLKRQRHSEELQEHFVSPTERP
ncbi:hypothetical protein CYMTET_4747 [Cymbomonas tetramitiformis]|uniref:Uncharacterized protein n=1 Tax=Cymbomonas tetramitiformis TaxID=36881 RepID=A0AAE0H0L5_9CHLO|nr:hypothetical protein CYMTET_4747 [Cymbomonas tetramitiformis]